MALGSQNLCNDPFQVGVGVQTVAYGISDVLHLFFALTPVSSHMFGGKTHASAMELADKLSAMVPMSDGRVFLGNSGSDANDTLLKLIRYHAEASGQPQRIKVIAREQGYHGVTLASAALTAIPTNHAHFQLPFEALGVLRTGSANYYRGAVEGETEAEFVARRANELESLILAEGPDTIAAMIAEPVSGAGGVIVPPAGYFEAIQAVLDRYGIWNGISIPS